MVYKSRCIVLSRKNQKLVQIVRVCIQFAEIGQCLQRISTYVESKMLEKIFQVVRITHIRRILVDMLEQYFQN